jgi:acetyl esterase/lipase
MTRQQFLRRLAGGALVAAATRTAHAQWQDPETVVYKVAQGCEIKADVYPAGKGARKPALLWIHGGALIGGSRKQIGTPMLFDLHQLGYVVVSIDYRLAPTTKVPQIIEDLQDAWQWLRKEGPARFGVDPDRIATAGGSAGGYLTLMSGFCLTPRPRALVSYFGYGDIDGPWLTQPSEFYRKQQLVSMEAARAGAGTAIISESPAGNRGNFYLMCRQQGIWPSEVSGHDPAKEPKWFDRYCPIRNVTGRYPPTLLIHGTADTDVPYEESKMMDAKLKEVGVEHEFLTVPGAGHGLTGAKPEDRKLATDRSVAWVKSHTT